VQKLFRIVKDLVELLFKVNCRILSTEVYITQFQIFFMNVIKVVQQ